MFYNHEGEILEPYSKAPLEVLHDKDLKDFSKLLYFELYSIYDQSKGKYNYVFVKNITLAKNMGVSEAHISKSLKDLEQHAYIKRMTTTFNNETSSKKRNIYLMPLKTIQSGENKGKVAYVVFPKSLYTTKMSGTSKLLLIEFLHLHETEESVSHVGHFQVSNNKLAKKFNKTKLTILRNIQELEEKEYLSIRRYDNKRFIEIEPGEIWFESYEAYYDS